MTSQQACRVHIEKRDKKATYAFSIYRYKNDDEIKIITYNH
jgi:hypothetical protein